MINIGVFGGAPANPLRNCTSWKVSDWNFLFFISYI